jgi:CheY-like chemotaxis protein/anti-sigma regulatory factor (Ser/Thr protein kinase)
VEIGLNASRSLLRVINDVLDLSKIESGKLALSEEPFDPVQTFEEVVGVFQPMAQKKGLELSLQMEPGLPRSLRGDPTRIRQVLFNLLGNAVKFTEEGSVRLEVWTLPGRQPEDRLRLLVAVTDTGPGIPDGKMDTVFEEFSQALSATSSSVQGTGLGLGIVKRLVHLMHGNLAVDSEEGRGTAVYWTLPLRYAQQRLGRGERAVGKSGFTSPGPVLVAEDDPTNRAVARKLLEDLGKRVICVENGREALQRIQEERFECVLMDIQMPELDGLEAIRRIRRMESVLGTDGGRLFVVAMTAFAMNGDQERCMEAGADEYIAKPIDLGRLREVCLKEQESGAGGQESALPPANLT